jgi:toxin ParE1/3/4
MKKYPIDFSGTSKVDIINIWGYIFNDSKDEEIADQVCDEIERTCYGMISSFPQLGTVRKHLGKEMRMYPVGNYNIYYYFDDEVVNILRVIRCSQDKKNNSYI